MHQVSVLEVQKYLAGVDYPATKHALLEAARENGAPQEVLRTIGHLSEGSIESPEELVSLFGDTAFGDTAEQQDEANRDFDVALGEGEDEGDAGYHIEEPVSLNENEGLVVIPDDEDDDDEE